MPPNIFLLPDFFSPYAPLTPDGPLPPGLTEVAVVNAYKSFGLRPKRVLTTLNIRRFHETPARRLRKALNRVENRELRRNGNEIVRPAFHNALYHYLRHAQHARDTYQRVIKPAEYDRDEAIYLDPERFRRLVDVDLKAIGNSLTTITPGGSLEALAHFALAFALLQPNDSYQIMEPLLLTGSVFQDYFGASQKRPTDVLSETQPNVMFFEAGADHTSNARTPSTPLTDVSTSSLTDEVSANTCRPEKTLREDQMADEAAESTSVTAHRIGIREAQLTLARSEYQTLSLRRRELGEAALLDEVRLKQAIDAERSAAEKFQHIVMRNRLELSQMTKKIESELRAEKISAEINHPELSNEQAVSKWLDERDAEISEVIATLEDLRKKRATLTSLNPATELSAEHSVQNASLQEILNVLRQRCIALDEKIAEVVSWKTQIAAAKSRMADCLSPKMSRSTISLDAERVVLLIKQAQFDESLEPLLPLLIRLLCENHRLTSPSHKLATAELVCNACNTAAIDGDTETHQDLLSYLTKEMILEALSNGNPVLIRHVLMFAFRESLSRQQPFFFEDVWPFEEWGSRVLVVGERLLRFFNTLQQLYWRTMNMSGLIQVLATGEAGAPDVDETEHRLAVIRRKAAEELATKLETPGMTGNFHRLRNIACTRFFKPLTVPIRGRQVRDVRIEHSKLERMLASGELEAEIGDTFGDTRELRRAHWLSLKRYVQSSIEAITEWIQQETAPEQSFAEDELNSELYIAASRLPEVDDTRSLGDAGTIEWLERTIRNLINSLRRNQFPEPALAFLGNLPSTDTLFGEPLNSARQPRIWPSWVDRNPRSERLWVCHLKGHLNWNDLLQDGIAKILLGRQRSEKEILESFIEAGEFEAVIEATKFPGFSSIDLKSLIEQAQNLFLRQSEVERKVYELDERLRRLLEQDHPSSLADDLKQIELVLLEALDDLEKLNLELAHRKVEQVEQSIDDVDEKIREIGEERSRRLAQLKSWFSGSTTILPEGVTIEEAELLADNVRYKERARRLHLLRLKEMDVPGVPEDLREAVRDYLRSADRPSRWPDEDAAERADLYVEYLTEISHDWWLMLRGLDPQDGTFRKIHEIATLLAERLPSEIAAITNQQTEQPLMLTLLFERSTNTISEYYDRLVEKQLIRSDTEESTFAFETRKPARPEQIDGWIQAQARVENIMQRSEIRTGSGQTVQDAYLAFGETRYEDSRDLAVAAWKTVENPDEKGPLAAIYAWSRFKTQPDVNERGEIDAIALLITHEARIRYRAPRVQTSHLLHWWLTFIEPDFDGAGSKSLGERIANILVKLVDSPSGANIRDRFSSVLHVTDATKLSVLLWESVRNLREETTKARTALLTLLFDFGKENALDHLFENAGNKRKYLSAFTALVMRARSDPSPKLHSAIIQNLRTLQTLKDRPFKEFAEAIARRLHYVSGRLQIEVSEILEPHQKPKLYTLVVSIAPDESDPPLSLSVELLDSEDCVCADHGGPRKEIVKESLLFERHEVEFLLRPRGRTSVFSVALQITGETASGQLLDNTQRFRVELGTEDAAFAAISINEILDIYEGYDAKPVSGTAFVGRQEELKLLERAVCHGDPGAVVLYGARRLGKTSLLNEVQSRYCVTNKKGSHTLFLSIPVDEFSLAETGKPFLERFFRHIWNSILHDFKNRAFRELLESWGVRRNELESLGRLGQLFDDASFLMKLRELLRRIRELSDGRINHVVFVMDEFDKLLEYYRKGYEADVEELTNQLRRAATEEADIGVILAGSDLMRNVVGQYRNALYGSATVIRLECFDGNRHRNDARRIVAPETLRGRRIFSEAVLDELVRITGGHPLYLRLVACAAAWLTRKRHVSRGDIMQAVFRLLRNDVLEGFLPDPPNLVVQPLQALRILDRKDQLLSEILLRQIARYTTLERPGVLWGAIAHDDRLLNLRPIETWTKIRDYLREANLIFQNERRQWVFRYPILGERLRVDLEIEMEKLQTEAGSVLGLEVA